MKGQQHMHMDEQRALRLLGSPERRVAIREIEVRAGSGSTFVVRGYASVTEHPYEVYGGPERGGWIETIKRGAFDTTLAGKPDVSFLLNHEGAPLARTRSGTLALRADNTGLESEATVDRRDPEGQSLEIKMERGDLDQMSFGFRTTRQSWNEDYTERDITEVNLDNGDVSVVNWPANPATNMSIVSASRALAVLKEMELTEARGLGANPAEELRAAQARITNLLNEIDPRPVVDLAEAVRRATEKGSLDEETARGLLLLLTQTDDDDDCECGECDVCNPSGDTGGTSGLTDPADAAQPNEDEDDGALLSLVQALLGIIGNSDLVLSPRSAVKVEPEVVTTDPAPVTAAEERTEPRETVRPSFRLIQARLAAGGSAA